jgi:hypothetical protein
MRFDDFKGLILSMAEDESVSLRQIQSVIARFFRNKPVPFVQSIQTFVVRCSINKPGEVFKNVNRCSYPPDEIKDRIGIQRANYKGQQVFYCSMPTDTIYATATLTCVLETAKEHIEDLNVSRTYCTVSRWTNCRPLELWVLPFSEECCARNGDIRTIRSNMQSLISKSFKDSQEFTVALEFISDAFSTRSNKQAYYRITSAFYNFIQYYERLTGGFRDGIMYPSANTDKAGLNLALKKELIDERILVCDNVLMMSIQRKPNNSKELTIWDCSDMAIPDPNGDIRFKFIV